MGHASGDRGAAGAPIHPAFCRPAPGSGRALALEGLVLGTTHLLDPGLCRLRSSGPGCDSGNHRTTFCTARASGLKPTPQPVDTPGCQGPAFL